MKALTDAVMRDKPPIFESKTHRIIPSITHKELWTFVSKSNPTSIYSINAPLSWILEHYVVEEEKPKDPFFCSLRRTKLPLSRIPLKRIRV